ncbi:hypothetical protein BWI17_05850 [Betaproteobacteria bacterium GR16-43]|nr:hypothetical protein BWI17_05850 [Betaproteobacteria bacterium GR16-43]
MNPLLRHAALAAAAFLAGCAAAPAHDPASAEPHHAEVAGAPIDLAAKFKMPNRERGRRDKAAMNARYQLETEADEKGPPTAAQIFRAHDQRHAMERDAASQGRAKAAGLAPTAWVALGPSNVGGRVRAIAFDPRNANRVFAGTASGGIWLSEDGGSTWRPNNDFLPNLSVTTIVVDPVNPNTMYLGTGEASAGLVGVGAFKSVDAGATWQSLASTNADANPDWRFVNRLAIHPAQPQVLLAAMTNNNLSTGAIYRSVDGGANWTRSATLKALDIAFDPANAANAVAGLDDGTIAYSRDGGVSWTKTAPLVATPSGRSNTARAEIAFARSQPGTVYASVDNEKGEVWKSVDSGANWAKLSTPAHLSGQGDYDNTIWADPTDPNHVVVAGLDVYQSRDGGVTFTQVSDWRNTPSSPHADHHALVSPPNFGPANPTLYNGNDGGIYRANNVYQLNSGSTVGIGWSNLNEGLAVTQFYSGAGRTAAGGRIVGGTQDNGSLVLDAGWRPFRGGDGGYSAVDPASDSIIYGEYVYLSVHRSTGGGVSTYICNGITEGFPSESGNTYCGANATKQANFIAPFILDPNNASRMLAGANSLWVSDNVRTGSPSWRTIKPPSAATENYINAIAVHEGNPNLAYVGHNNGEVYRSNDAAGPAPTWTRVGQGTLPARRVQRITIDRANPNRAIVAVTGFVANNVWQTLDGGATWASITSNLPNAPVFDVKLHPLNAQWLYAATSVGIFTSENGGATWSTTNEGPANIRVRELFWLDNATLGAATYGRGMYKASVPGGGPNNYQDLWWAGAAENGWGMSITQHGSILFLAFYIYDAQGKPQWVVLPGGAWNAGFTAYSGSLYLPTGSFFGAYDVNRFSVNPPVGTATVTFTSLTTATLAYTINGVSGTKSIQRQVYGRTDATPTASYADLWWGGFSQNGWGVAINQQYRNIFAVWYTYDAAGKTVWYVVPDGQWADSVTYTGTAYRTSGSAWVGVPYDPAVLQVLPVGTITFRFTDLSNGTMTYNVDGVSQSKPIVRQPF